MPQHGQKHLTSLPQFAQQLPQEVAGLHQHEGAEEAASVPQQHFIQDKGSLITLDHSQCYDRMDVHASYQFLPTFNGRQLWCRKCSKSGRRGDFSNLLAMCAPHCFKALESRRDARLLLWPWPVGWAQVLQRLTTWCKPKVDILRSRLPERKLVFTWMIGAG